MKGRVGTPLPTGLGFAAIADSSVAADGSGVPSLPLERTELMTTSLPHSPVRR